MNNFDQRFGWQAKYVPQIIQIIAPYILQVTPVQIDQKENADLIIRTMRNQTIGCRLRTPAARRFIGEVTLRAKLPSGTRTELDKIIDGKGDLFFYGHVNEDDAIWHWYLIDYTKLRALFIRNSALLSDSQRKKNPDGSEFLVLNVEEQIDEAVIARSSPTATQQTLELL